MEENSYFRDNIRSAINRNGWQKGWFTMSRRVSLLRVTQIYINTKWSRVLGTVEHTSTLDLTKHITPHKSLRKAYEA